MRETDKTIEAMKQALEALESGPAHWESEQPDHEAAITVLRAAITEASMQRLTDVQQEMEQEPVAFMWDYKRLDGHVETKAIFAHHYKTSPGDLAYVLKGRDATPLYTHPPRREWVGLTDEEVQTIWKDATGCGDPSHDDEDLVRAIEAKLKEKNT